MKRIRLTEAQLHRVIKESVKNILKEINEPRYTSKVGDDNRAQFRDRDMEYDFWANEPMWLDEPKRDWKELTPEEQNMYRFNPSMMNQTLDCYKRRQMEDDYENYGNPNI